MISLEGIEGCGKTTQIRLLSRFLQHAGRPHVVTREPGGTPLGEAVRRLLLDPENGHLPPLVDLLLYNAARAQHLQAIIEPALAAGKDVLIDRYKDATLAYQGYGSGLSPALIQKVHGLEGLKREPDLTLLLDLPVELGLLRARSRNMKNRPAEGRYENMDLDFHRRVQAGYRKLAAAQPDRIVTVDGSGPREEVQARLQAVLTRRLALQNGR